MKKQLAEIIGLRTIYDPRGNLTVIEENNPIPFNIGNVEWICIGKDSLSSEVAPNHSAPQLMLIALSGEIKLHLESEKQEQEIWLINPRQGAIIREKCHLRIIQASNDAILLKLSGKEENN